MDKFYQTFYRPKMCVSRIGDMPRYGNGVWAESEEHAEELIVARQIPGETLDDAMPSTKSWHPPAHTLIEDALLHMRSRKKFNEGLHSLTFICYMAACANGSGTDMLGDGGVLHEFIHIMTGTSDMWCKFEHIMIAVLDVEMEIPGYLSKVQIEDASRYKTTLQRRIARKA